MQVFLSFSTFNPIKVLFLQTDSQRQEEHLRDSLSILSRFYFYQSLTEEKYMFVSLSILSRFYFYTIQSKLKTLYPSAFNPIKVLFLHLWNSSNYGSALLFQSYQGSIFTKGNFLRWKKGTHFQSYQGSIFTNIWLSSRKDSKCFQSYQGSIFTRRALCFVAYLWSSFNPIKVLFLLMHVDQCRIKICTFNPIKVLFLHN